MPSRRLSLLVLCALAAFLSVLPDARAQGTGDARIVWEVKNRFRLFKEERDFQLHVDALRGHSILESEQIMARDSEGRGWARNTVRRLCIDAVGRIAQPCNRDGVDEDYLSPKDHRVSFRVIGADNASCTWLFDNGQQNAAGFLPCSDPIEVRVASDHPTPVSVDIRTNDGTGSRLTTEIAVRDILIAGLGDSIASGEGNPDRPVALSDDGFCFRQFVGTASSDYYRPGRAGFKGDKSCSGTPATASAVAAWNKLAAQWQNSACHRSLYSYQMRAAIALAVENRHIAVTFLPLACSGSTIDAGILGPRRARELNCGGSRCPASVPSQISQLTNLLTRARQRDKSRMLDLVLLTVGANDINFSGIVADVIISEPWSRALFKRSGMLGSLSDSQAMLNERLPSSFQQMRAALRPLVPDLSHVIFTSYADPVLTRGGEACEIGKNGFDIHPAFAADPQRLQAATQFVEGAFLPRLKALATCTGGTLCAPSDAMTFVDAHQQAFDGHGMCARAPTDPAFDNDCFSVSGDSFQKSLAEAATSPLVCGRPASEFRAYASRARWIRTANDSYFAAMTYPEGVSQGMQPSDIHDATWGILSAVYGGAVHPTAEGHAVMADAALVQVQHVLGVGTVDPPVTATPLPAPTETPAPPLAPMQAPPQQLSPMQAPQQQLAPMQAPPPEQ
jgi:hypothetical protein